jgi:hypothetical protein
VSDLGEWIGRLLTPRTEAEPRSVREIAQAHLAEAGSKRKAAKLWGVNESVFRRLVNGQTTSPKASTIAKAWGRERERSARRITNQDIRIPVTEKRPSRSKGGAGRHRELTAVNLKITDPAAADRIRAAYVSGGPEAAAAQLLKEINDRHYQRWLTPDSMRPRPGGGGQGGGGGAGGGPGGGGPGGPGGGGGGPGGGGAGDDLSYEGDDYPESDYGYGVG